MIDPQRVVENIRNLLHYGHEPPLDVLQALAADYTEACQEVNRRLARCEEYLRQGLRAEAIHYAQAEPNLLDVLAVLDFTERLSWDQLLTARNLAPAPLFRMETAAALNRAYADAQPVEHLMRQHRLLALARAPLGERLAVLRQLAQVDAGNPVWQQDIPAFEMVRVQQVQSEVEQLRTLPAMPPLEQVQALLQEVQGSPWRTPLPPGLPAMLQEMYQRVSTSHWQMRQQQLARELPAARKDRDEARARRLAQEWHQAWQNCPLAPNDPHLLAAAPALRWLERVERRRADASAHQQAVEILQLALRNPAINADELEEIFLEAAESKTGVPPQLEDAYNRRMYKLHAASQRWERLILVTVCSLAVIVFVGFMVYLLHPAR